MNKIIEQLTDSRDEALANVKWSESEAKKKRELGRAMLQTADEFEETAKEYRDEADQCEKALKALQSGDRLSVLETFYQEVSEARNNWVDGNTAEYLYSILLALKKAGYTP